MQNRCSYYSTIQ